MTDDLLARARQALDGVTEGPWRVGNVGNDFYHDIYSDAARTFVFEHDPGPRREDAEFIAAARTLIPELIDALKAEQARLAEWRAQYDDLAAENERLRAQLDAVPSAIRAYAGGELDGYSYHGDGSAIEALRRLSEHAENIRDYAGTRQETTDEQ